MNSKIIVGIMAGVILILMIAGFNLKKRFVEPSSDQVKPLVCLDCHRSANINTNEGVAASKDFCFNCHQKENCLRNANGIEISLQVTAEVFEKNQRRHQFIACIQCHTDVARSPHKTEIGATCLSCHSIHGEATANDPHLRVSCQACHFKSPFVFHNLENDQIVLKHFDSGSKPISLADHALEDVKNKKSCEKCHYKGNLVDAPAAVLPSKGVLCILCHNSPLAIGHPIFGAAMLVFAIGILMTLRFWYLGSVQGEETSLHKKISLSSETIWDVIFSKRLLIILKTLLWDIIFQRRILKESMGRWSMHSLIYLAILMRFLLSLTTGVLFFLKPDSDWAIALIDKNNPLTAFMNDLLGLLILVGILWAVGRRLINKPAYVISEYQDNLALGLIGTLVLVGFVLESTRILATGISDKMAMASIIGYPLSKIMGVINLKWSSVYGYLWYLHGILAAIFVGYLPFGKMRHIFSTPMTYILEEVGRETNQKRV